MLKNIIKVFLLILVTIFSLNISALFINNHVLEVEAREKDIADIIIKKQMQEALKTAEEKIEIAKKEENITVETKELEMKPPVVEEKSESYEAETPTNENDKANNDIKEISQENEQEKISDDFQVSADKEEIIVPGLGELDQLNEESIENIGKYLIDNYFLNGYMYAENETNSELKIKKEFVRDMEAYVTESLEIMIEILDHMQSVNLEGINEIKNDIEKLSIEFKQKYEFVGEDGEDLGEIYSYINQYFDKSLHAINKTGETVGIASESSNPLLAITVVLSNIEKEIMPAFREVLNSGFDLKEKTNAVYLEGVEGKSLMTKDEVMEIIKSLEKSIFNQNN